MSFDPTARVHLSKVSPSLQAKRLIHTAVATALGLSGIPVAVGQNASLEEVAHYWQQNYNDLIKLDQLGAKRSLQFEQLLQHP